MNSLDPLLRSLNAQMTQLSSYKYVLPNHNLLNLVHQKLRGLNLHESQSHYLAHVVALPALVEWNVMENWYVV